MQASLFRAIENRRELIRATNTGVSCFIDKYGRIRHYVEDEAHKRTYVTGFAICDVAFSEERTFYTKHGDIFTYLCFGRILLGAIRRI